MGLSSNALITLEEFFVYQGDTVETESENDKFKNQIIAHINTVSQLIANYCHRAICPVTAIAEKFNGDGTDDYYVKHGNISGTPMLYYYNGTDWTEMDTTTYPRDVDSTIGLVELLEGVRFAEGKKNYKIAYDTGWAVANIPAPIKHACFIDVQRFLLSATGKEGVKSEGFNEATTSYDLHEISKKAKELLNPYRRISFV